VYLLLLYGYLENKGQGFYTFMRRPDLEIKKMVVAEFLQ